MPPWDKYRNQAPADPTFDLKRPQASANVQKTQAEIDALRQRNQNQAVSNSIAQEQAARTRTQYPISKEDAAIIDRMRQEAQSAQKAVRELNTAAAAVDRFGTGPEQALRAKRSLVTEDDGLLEQAARNVYGSIAGVSDQNLADYQDLDRLRQARVASIQQEQKGAQTESDAARYMKSTFGPDKNTDVNARTIAEATYAAQMDTLKPQLFSKWANTFGSLNALNRKGQSVDQWWSETVRKGWEEKFLKQSDSGRRLYGGQQQPRAAQPQQRVIDWDEY